MKTLQYNRLYASRLIALLLIFVAFTDGFSASDSAPPAPPPSEQLRKRKPHAPAYTRQAVKLATQFLQGKETSDAALDSFVAQEEIVGPSFLNAFLDAVRTGREIAVETDPKSKHFPTLLADSFDILPVPDRVNANPPPPPGNSSRAASVVSPK